ncbi:MAG: hypothetical protein RIS86_922 [Planctomycetota bacterium]
MDRTADHDRFDGRRAAIVPATPSPRVRSVFASMVGRMLRRDFHAVRVSRGSRAALEAVDGGARPALVVLNHTSWWDPLVAISAWRAFFRSRAPYGPIDRHELARFAIFRKVGLFGVDPDDPATLGAMRAYLGDVAARDPRFAFVVTPQGAFADVRDRIVPRPGAAAIATALAPDRAVSIAIEYAFWTDRKPEVFVRAEPIACEAAGLLGWQRRIAAAMQANQDALAALVRARDAAAFEPFAPAFAPRASGANPVYDLWMRLTGRRADAALGEARVAREAR